MNFISFHRLSANLVQFPITAIRPSLKCILQNTAARGIARFAGAVYPSQQFQIEPEKTLESKSSSEKSPRSECPVLNRIRCSSSGRLPYKQALDEFNFYMKMRVGCKALFEKEDKNVNVKIDLLSAVEELAEDFENASPGPKNDFNSWDDEWKEKLLHSEYWLALIKGSKSEDCFILKNKLRKSNVTDLKFCTTLANLYDFVTDFILIPYKNPAYDSEDVLEVLNEAKLTEDDMLSLRILFSLKSFEKLRF